MRVVCFYTELHPKTLESLTAYAPNAELVETPKGDPYAYVRELESRWTGDEDLVVVEHDKEITADTLPTFESCRLPWCIFDYYIYPEPQRRLARVGLGCARFTAACQRIVTVTEWMQPDSPEWKECYLCHGKGCWRYMDSRIASALEAEWLSPHVHGLVAHHHDYTGVKLSEAEW